ncbi:hypothetical protein WR25_03330 [Diploscapter pachys]|uniref:SSD domain-containing protein n=1 Tax=Diploscapter pachys TaxID=2018661 RepID=A0A2A2L383_9BILA|nr:hypothetical protein WR25_03330 [Diploscapter pachys]
MKPLARGFGSVGAFVGSWPLLCFIISLLTAGISLVSLIIWRPEIKLSFETGYTKPDAPSIKELQAQVQFFGDQGAPWYMALFAEPKRKGGSMIGTKEFYEFERFYKHLKKDLIIKEDENRTYNYYDYCTNMCGFNDVVFKTYDMSILGLSWPVSSVFGYESNIGKHFFKREMDKDGGIKSSNLSALYFMVFINSTTVNKDMEHFERLVAEEVKKHNANESTYTLLTQHGAVGMKTEMRRGTQVLINRFTIGFFLTVFIILITLLGMAWFHHRAAPIVVFLWPIAALVPALSLIVAFAIFNLTGKYINALMFLSPLLSYGLGLDAILMLYNTWLVETNLKRDGNSEHMMEVFAACFPSITIVFSTALTLFLGAFYPIEELANFSLLLGISAVMTYFYVIFFFAPCMLWCFPAKIHRKLSQFPEPCCKGIRWLLNFMDKYAKWLASSTLLKIFAVFFVFVCTGFVIYAGSNSVEANLDYRHLLPPDSPNNKGVEIMSDVVWPDFLHIVIFIERPPNFTDPEDYMKFENFIHDLEHLKGAIGPESNMLWVKDFKRFVNSPANATSLNMTAFEPFITDGIYSAWNSGVRYSRNVNGTFEILRMVFMIAFQGAQTLADKGKIVEACRNVSSYYPEFEAVPFDTEVGMADVINQIPCFLFTLSFSIPAFIFFVFFMMTYNIFIGLLAAISAYAIPTATLCLCSIFGMTLNPFSTAVIYILYAIAAKYSAHICYFFYQAIVITDKRDALEKIQETHRRSLFPVIMSTIIGSIILLPVLTTSIKIFLYIAILNVVSLVYGFIYAQFVLPALLIMMPNACTRKNCWSDS